MSSKLRFSTENILAILCILKILIQKIAKAVEYGAGYRDDDKTLNMEAVLLGFQSFTKREYSRKDRDFLERHA